MERGDRVWYLYIHSILEGYAPASKIFQITELTSIMRCWRIPHHLRYPIVKELIEMKLLEKTSAYEVRLINTKRNKIIQDSSKLNHALGMF